MAKIILVDDDIDIAEILSRVLRDEGYDVLTLNNVGDAVPIMLDEKPDLAIIDIMFPGNAAGGFDLSQEIREHDTLEDLPIIMLTSVNEEFLLDFSNDDIDNDWMPVQEFIEKPPDIPALLKKINVLLG